MRIFPLLLCGPLVACATGAPDENAGPRGAHTDSGAAGSPDAGELDGPSDGGGDALEEASTWPGSCADGAVEDCYTGPPNTKDVGACKHGTHACANGHFPTTCTGDVLPAAQETCNGVDDNCDGTVDEGCACTDGATKACYGGAAGTEGVGPCKGGTQSCTGGKWGPCTGSVLPAAAETCNGVDDDCNGTIDDKAGLRLYSMPLPGTAWTWQYLSDAWTGTNAPPRCADVMETVQLTDIGRLLVFMSDGMMFWRVNGAWKTPVVATSRFPSLPATIDSVYELPHSLFGGGALGADVTFTSAPYAYQYVYDQNDSVSGFQSSMMSDETPNGGPNRLTGHELWSFAQDNPALFGKSADAFYEWLEFSDGRIYRFDAAFEWHSLPVAQSSLWSGKANPPPVGQCVAAYADHAPDRAYLLCP